MTTDAQVSGSFDQYAADYDSVLEQGISVSGEDKEFFARGRVEWVTGRLKRLAVTPRRVLDFGCGTGSAAPLLLDCLRAECIVGVDTSARSIDVARIAHPDPRCQFMTTAEYRATGDIDLAFCNGVFHHIPPAERMAAVEHVRMSLRPAGWFAFWENNPWNPGTRYVMSRIPFDRDAIALSPTESRRMLTEGGFVVLRTDFLFVFPRVLRALRPLEPAMSSLPFGAQYGILARKR